MTDYEDTDDTSAEDNKKKKGGKGEIESAGRSRDSVPPGFFEYMDRIGATAAQVAEVLRNWRPLHGEGLLRALIDLARGTARASAHAEVEISRNKDYGLVHNLFAFFKKDLRAPVQKHTFDDRIKPGPH